MHTCMDLQYILCTIFAYVYYWLPLLYLDIPGDLRSYSSSSSTSFGTKKFLKLNNVICAIKKNRIEINNKFDAVTQIRGMRKVITKFYEWKEVQVGMEPSKIHQTT